MLRVTSQLTTQFALQGARRQSAAAAKATIQLSTGKRLQRPSDDVLAYQSVVSLRSESRRLEAENQNIESARFALNTSVSRLTEAKNLLTSAYTTALQSRQDQRDTLANSIDGVLNKLVDLANDQSQGRRVFGGLTPQTAPVEAEFVNGQIVAVRYTGSDQPISIPIGASFAVETSAPARSVFQSNERGALLLVGDTGTAVGSGTDSARAFGELRIEHTSTSYAPGSGVAAGANSAGGDTILGPLGAHTLQLTDLSGAGAFGEVSLNNGPAVAFTAADTNLRLEGPDGEVVYLDLSSVAAGFSGTIDIAAAGAASLDDGASWTPIDFSANQTLVNSATGETVNIDTSGTRRTGVEHVEHPGGADAFSLLIALRDDLRGQRGLNEPQHQQAITRHLGELERLTDHLLGELGDQAVALENLDSTQLLNDDVQLETQVSLSRLEDADIAETVLNLQSAQTILQATYAATAQVFGVSLLDYL